MSQQLVAQWRIHRIASVTILKWPLSQDALFYVCMCLLHSIVAPNVEFTASASGTIEGSNLSHDRPKIKLFCYCKCITQGKQLSVCAGILIII